MSTENIDTPHSKPAGRCIDNNPTKEKPIRCAVAPKKFNFHYSMRLSTFVALALFALSTSALPLGVRNNQEEVCLSLLYRRDLALNSVALQDAIFRRSPAKGSPIVPHTPSGPTHFVSLRLFAPYLTTDYQIEWSKRQSRRVETSTPTCGTHLHRTISRKFSTDKMSPGTSSRYSTSCSTRPTGRKRRSSGRSPSATKWRAASTCSQPTSCDSTTTRAQWWRTPSCPQSAAG